jgi:hypothetical protein
MGMPYITLAVAPAVINQVKSGQEFAKQIAVRGFSEDLGFIRTATAKNKRPIKICGVFDLMIGDNGAIWARQQTESVQADDFSNFYSLLERRPDVNVTFKW